MWSHMGEAASLTPGIRELGFRGRFHVRSPVWPLELSL